MDLLASSKYLLPKFLEFEIYRCYLFYIFIPVNHIPIYINRPLAFLRLDSLEQLDLSLDDDKATEEPLWTTNISLIQKETLCFV